MTDSKPPGLNVMINPTLISGPFVIPASADDASFAREAAVILAALDDRPPTRAARIAATVWFAWSSVWSILGPAVIISLGIVFFWSSGREVVRAIGRPTPDSVVVRAGGPLTFTLDVERLEACPGEVIDLFHPRPVRPTDRTTAVVIQQRRPAQDTVVRRYEAARITTTVPPTLTPGPWRYTWIVDSKCFDREHEDTVAEFDIEVAP